MNKSTQTSKSTQAFLCCHCDRLSPLCAVDLDALFTTARAASTAACVHCGTSHAVAFRADTLIHAEMI